MMTRAGRQEALSRAYVRAVAAQTGYIVSEPKEDYGIDMSLRAITMRGERRRDVGPQVDLQLKSTTRTAVTADRIAYDLDVVNYDDLRTPTPVPRLLVVLLQPTDEAEWLRQTA